MRSHYSYDTTESTRLAFEWMGASAKTFWSFPYFGFSSSFIPKTFSSWGKVVERSFSRIVEKPDWNIHSIVSNHTEYLVMEDVLLDRPFCKLKHFRVIDRTRMPQKVLIIAPMSGHYPTLLRKTVRSLLPDCEVYITEWKNARDIPVSEGKFDIEDFTEYLKEFILFMGPDTHIISVCQPVPLTLAATAMIAEDEPEKQPKSMILFGGPVDPNAAPTEVTDFGNSVTMGQLEHLFIQNVGSGYNGVGRLVFPGIIQLSSFMSMNAHKHCLSFMNQILNTARGEASDHDRHNDFYDEYLAVMDLTAEFYLSTVQRIFKSREIAKNCFTVKGRRVDLGKISKTAVKIVEGENDDISAPGQCSVALKLLTGLPEDKKASHVEPKAGHYGIFSGKVWLNNIRPLVLDFMRKN
ncbi:MAG: polyhydroxyalkanoate depolymerase [Rhodobacteraceae bacterium]|nr:polyhydroxyalkanoate depolymerase [Paracoccaceae bacterium]